MLIKRLTIENFKSIRCIALEPKDLTVLVGANASGKSNLAECFDFISEAYRHGLEVAVARKGGYENIAHRRIKRSKASVKIGLITEFQASTRWWPHAMAKVLENRRFRVEHNFSFAAKNSSIRAEFQVDYELLLLQISTDTPSGWEDIMQVIRKGDTITYRPIDDEKLKTLFPELEEKTATRYFRLPPDLHYFTEESELVQSTELIAVQVGRFIPFLRDFILETGGIRVFQISPGKSREFGVPTPGPELDRTGANLPAVIDLLQKKHKPVWALILQHMRRVLPMLTRIDVAYSTARTLGLRFSEKGAGRPWNVDEVSDGTIQTLSLLVAIFDPRSQMLILEEPENSVHPWIVRAILDACNNAAAKKQILITTHSPIVIDHVPPEKIWIIWRSNSESKIGRLTELDPDSVKMWEEGEISTFELLDSGTIRQALPPAPINTEEEVS